MRFDRLVAVAALGSSLAACASSHAPLPVAAAPAPALDPARAALLDQSSRDALERGIASGKLADNKVAYSVVLADDAARFETGRFSLSPAVREQLLNLVAELRADQREAYLEIQGHTDSVGSSRLNQRLGLRRAEAVRRYLAGQGLAAERMTTVSYGEDAPVAPNADPDGRAENRRVVIIVLS